MFQVVEDQSYDDHVSSTSRVTADFESLGFDGQQADSSSTNNTPLPSFQNFGSSMKIYNQQAASPEGIHSWVQEDFLDNNRYGSNSNDFKADPLDFIKDLPDASLHEMKPMEPVECMASPDTSISAIKIEPSPASSSPINDYKSAITNNSFLSYSLTPEPVSTTTPQSNTSLITVKEEQLDQQPNLSYSVLPQSLDQLAAIITNHGDGNTLNGNALNANSINGNFMDDGFASETLLEDSHISEATIVENPVDDNSITQGFTTIPFPEPSSFQQLNVMELDQWLTETCGPSVKSEQSDPLVNSTMSPPHLSPSMITSQLPHSSTNLQTTLSEFAQQSQNNSTPMLQQLLASGTVSNNNNNNNSNYLAGLMNEASIKQDLTMPILQARLTQNMKDNLHIPGTILKADPMFGRASYYINKDSLPHSTDLSSYTTVSTTDDFMKYEVRAFLDKTQLASPESTDYSDLKGKNKNRLKSTKIPIRTEGTKDKPVHHCTICHRGFLNKSNIKVHLRTHTGEKPFKCETCNKAFRQKAHLIKHYQIHRRGSRE